MSKIDSEETLRLTDALEQLRRLREVLEGVRVHQLALLNANFESYNNLLMTVDTRLYSEGYYIPYWDTLENFGFTGRALSFFSATHRLSGVRRSIRYFNPEDDEWFTEFLNLVDSLYNEMDSRTMILLHGDNNDTDAFLTENTLLCQMLGHVLQYVYDWQVNVTISPVKEYIQKDQDWINWVTNCVWIMTRMPDTTLKELYEKCISTEKTLKEEFNQNVVQHFVDNKEHYEPKLPKPVPNPDDMDLGVKMTDPSRHITTVLPRCELLEYNLKCLQMLSLPCMPGRS